MRLAGLILIGALLAWLPMKGQPLATDFEHLDSLQKINPRPLVVFLHTHWCKYCEAMKNTTFRDKGVRDQLDSDFYYISFDGESKQDVNFLGRTFNFKPSGNNTGVHELAEQLGTRDGKVTYPTLVFLNQEYEILYQHVGFVNAADLRRMLNNVLEAVE